MNLLKLLASIIYGGVTDLRRVLYDSGILSVYRSSLPVVSVGNLTVGGNGKSPFVAFLAEGLVKRGYHPVVLLRGYRGSERGPYRVLPSESPARVGDEALMHARRFGDQVPVVISRRRAEGAKLIESLKLGDVILLDDGFQHRALGRECDLVLWALAERSSAAELEGARLLPLGSLRERIAPALKRAQAIVWVKKGELVGEINNISDLPQFLFTLEPSVLRDVYSGEERGLQVLRGAPCRCLTAIAEPGSLLRVLTESCGARVTNTLLKRDHDSFSLVEWQKFCAVGDGMAICTEKDEEKLRPYLKNPGELFSLRLRGTLGMTEGEFFSYLGQRIGSVQRVRNDNRTSSSSAFPL